MNLPPNPRTWLDAARLLFELTRIRVALSLFELGVAVGGEATKLPTKHRDGV
jgi:hypothetical protein